MINKNKNVNINNNKKTDTEVKFEYKIYDNEKQFIIKSEVATLYKVKSYDILSKKDIEKLRKAYNNYSISQDYLNFEVKNIMKHERISKDEAISNILKLVNN